MLLVIKEKNIYIRRHRFPSRKFKGANQNAAWIIHEIEKYLFNWFTFSKPMRDKSVIYEYTCNIAYFYL